MTWDVDPVFFQLPLVNFPIRYYGVIFSLNFLLGLALFAWQIKRSGAPLSEALDFVWPGFWGLVVGARLGHVFFYNFDYFLKDPLWIFRVWEGGLASHGAALGLVVAIWWHSRRKKRPFWDTFDRLTFSGALGAALIRLGNFFNSEIVGKVTTSKFSLKFPRFDWNLPPDLVPFRYPTQLFEFGAGLIVFGSLIGLDFLMGREKRPQGFLAAAFLILYFTARFIIEFFKARHGPNDDLFLSKGQLLSIFPILFGVGLLVYALKKAKA
ncbi:MAG: prolipoprotein diacylglyceryl transferase [Deltaproteobacteria bacterium]|jgi:prolipoprotein diacylglyceryl transferase|nr:prolipoprotein diacylglyceryl transferase [Deltaproteobacteria bacterium]